MSTNDKEKEIKVKSDSSWVCHAKGAWISMCACACELTVVLHWLRMYVDAAGAACVKTDTDITINGWGESTDKLYDHMIWSMITWSQRWVTLTFQQFEVKSEEPVQSWFRKVSVSRGELWRVESPWGPFNGVPSGIVSPFQ